MEDTLTRHGPQVLQNRTIDKLVGLAVKAREAEVEAANGHRYAFKATSVRNGLEHLVKHEQDRLSHLVTGVFTHIAKQALCGEWKDLIDIRMEKAALNWIDETVGSLWPHDLWNVNLTVVGGPPQSKYGDLLAIWRDDVLQGEADPIVYYEGGEITDTAILEDVREQLRRMCG